MNAPGQMSLSDFRVDVPTVSPDEVAFEGEPVFKSHDGLLAFDQSIAATGWVYLVSGTKGVIVRECGSLAIPPDGYPKGHEGTLMRADTLGFRVETLLKRMPVLTVIHETPPIATGKMSRPESSLVSAAVIRQVAHRAGIKIVMVSNQHSKKVLVGNGNADKKHWHKALDRLPWSAVVKPTNEGQRDALCLALTYLIEES